MLAWLRGLSRVAKVCGAVGLITGAIIGVAGAWPIIEWLVPAHRGYVLEQRGYVLQQVGDVRVNTNELLLWKFEDQKNTLSREQRGLNILLKKETDPALQHDIQRSIDKSSKEEVEIIERIKKIKGK